MIRSLLVIRTTLCLLLAATMPAASVLVPSRASAQAEEASLLFERANAHLARGLRARGRARTRELEQALDAYQGVLRLGTRTRNVVFNTALTLAELGRAPEAFNYYSEYLRSFDLSDDERAEGTRRIDALRPEVAVLMIETTPPGAEVRLDRRDLPVRGSTPLELAVTPGEHQIFLAHAGFAEATTSATAVVGSSALAQAQLTGEPVQVQFIAPGGGRLTLDGQEIAAGRAIPVAPGSHLVRLEMPGSPPIERQFEVNAGDAPMRLELSGGPAPIAHDGPSLALRMNTPGAIFVDTYRVGWGQQVDLPIAPGIHMLRIEAPGRTTLHHRLTVNSAQRLALDVHLGAGPDPTGLYVARAIFAVLAVGGLGTSIGMFLWANDLNDAWEEGIRTQTNPGGGTHTSAQLHALADELELVTLGTDLSFGITAAVGLTALITLFVGPGGGEPSTVQLVGAPGGAALAWRTP